MGSVYGLKVSEPFWGHGFQNCWLQCCNDLQHPKCRSKIVASSTAAADDDDATDDATDAADDDATDDATDAVDDDATDAADDDATDDATAVPPSVPAGVAAAATAT